MGSKSRHLFALLDTDKDGIADVVKQISNQMRAPNGVAIQNGSLYIGTLNKIVKWPGRSETNLDRPLKPLATIFTGLNNRAHHGYRVIAFGPDRKLYVAIGAPCNVCLGKGHEGRIIRMDANGTNIEVVARGVRNSVGFDWHPKTKELFFTDNGSDGLGDDIPADELNHVTQAGQHFGFPYYGGGDTRTPQFKGKPAPEGAKQPAIKFQAHSANLGLHFYRGHMFPAEYKHDAFVAQHGSWNRSSPVGYRIMRIRFNRMGLPVGKEVFASGWLEGDDYWGRPVGIEELPDGSLLVSDDFVGAVYRISYGG
ncbi:MAG: PQQ-dependent sugar dehydrogenase [Rhodospirillales bacterium]|nr:PQQ-dependent sugar dehydrogenase [Rhodospirillales bacterium]